jgi:hypothetical protein
VVCFWGELAPYAPWKRKLLPWLALSLLVGIAACFYVVRREPNSWVILLVAAPVLLGAPLGIASAIWGCDSCVVRLWGKA